VTSGSTKGANDRLEELLVESWGSELGPAEHAELRRLVEANPEASAELERAAGASVVAFARADGAAPPLPSTLRAQIRAQAASHLPATRARPPDSMPGERGGPRELPPQRKGPGMGWGVALAASVALAVAGWLPWIGPKPPPPEPVVVEVPVDPPPPPPPRERMAALRSAGATAIDWSTTEDPWVDDEVEGQIVWSTAEQEGYMHFRGLPPNDPAEHRYQLWIFDATRDDRYPVDGGIFDVPAASEETVVPIAPKLPVGEPELFAVTLEGPRGVVVSDREHILVVAPVE